MNKCWVIPKNAPAAKRDVQWTDKRELEDGGYAHFRISVDDGESRQASVYVQDASRRMMDDSEWKKAAWELFGTHNGLQVLAPDGTLVGG